MLGCGRAVWGGIGWERGLVTGAEGEREDGKCEQEDEVVDDDLNERWADEEGAERAKEDVAAVFLEPREVWWRRGGGECVVFGEELVAEKAEGQKEQGEVAGEEIEPCADGDKQSERKRWALECGPCEEREACGEREDEGKMVVSCDRCKQAVEIGHAMDGHVVGSGGGGGEGARAREQGVEIEAGLASADEEDGQGSQQG